MAYPSQLTPVNNFNVFKFYAGPQTCSLLMLEGQTKASTHVAQHGNEWRRVRQGWAAPVVLPTAAAGGGRARGKRSREPTTGGSLFSQQLSRAAASLEAVGRGKWLLRTASSRWAVSLESATTLCTAQRQTHTRCHNRAHTPSHLPPKGTQENSVTTECNCRGGKIHAQMVPKAYWEGDTHTRKKPLME